MYLIAEDKTLPTAAAEETTECHIGKFMSIPKWAQKTRNSNSRCVQIGVAFYYMYTITCFLNLLSTLGKDRSIEYCIYTNRLAGEKRISFGLLYFSVIFIINIYINENFQISLLNRWEGQHHQQQHSSGYSRATPS